MSDNVTPHALVAEHVASALVDKATHASGLAKAGYQHVARGQGITLLPKSFSSTTSLHFCVHLSMCFIESHQH